MQMMAYTETYAALVTLTARYDRVIALAFRETLSSVEEVLSIPFLSHRSVMSYLRWTDGKILRTASSACHKAVSEHKWLPSQQDSETGEFSENKRSNSYHSAYESDSRSFEYDEHFNN